MTDPLAKLARNDDQISAVLAHEIGHVRHRHGLRISLQAAGLAALAAALFGDATSITSLATTLPAALLQSGYSREFETEADDYAFQRLREVGLSPKAFADIMLLLEKSRQKATGGGTRDYLSTHPATAKRIQRALSEKRPHAANQPDHRTHAGSSPFLPMAITRSITSARSGSHLSSHSPYGDSRPAASSASWNSCIRAREKPCM